MSQIAYNPYQAYDKRSFQPTDRFYVRASVFLPNADVDPATGMLKQDSRRRGRTQALRMEARRLDYEYDEMDKALKARQNEKGIRGARIPSRYGTLLICAFVLIFGVILLTQQGKLSLRVKILDTMNQNIETVRDENEALQAQIDEASDASNICYTAARDLDMVPSNSAQAIHLTAVDTRPEAPTGRVTASADGQTADNTAAGGE